MKRRNLSGIFIFEKFEDDDRERPTVFEDCTEATQEKWLDSLETDGLKNLAKQLGKTVREIGDTFDILKE